MTDFKDFILGEEWKYDDHYGIVTPAFRKLCQKEFKRILSVKGTKITTGQKLRYEFNKDTNTQYCTITVEYTTDELKNAYLDGFVRCNDSLKDASPEVKQQKMKEARAKVFDIVHDRIAYIKRTYGVTKEIFNHFRSGGKVGQEWIDNKVYPERDVRLAPAKIKDNFYMSYLLKEVVSRYGYVNPLSKTNIVSVQETFIFSDKPHVFPKN